MIGWRPHATIASRGGMPSTRPRSGWPSALINGNPRAANAGVCARLNHDERQSRGEALFTDTEHGDAESRSKQYYLRGYVPPCVIHHMPLYWGPPPPSGGTQVMTWYGSMMSHVLQWTQFDALICSRGVPSASWAIS